MPVDATATFTLAEADAGREAARVLKVNAASAGSTLRGTYYGGVSRQRVFNLLDFHFFTYLSFAFMVNFTYNLISQVIDDMFNSIRTFAFFFYLAIIYAASASLVFLASFLVRDKATFFHLASQLWVRYFAAPFSGIRIICRDFHNIPKDKPVIFAINHQSMLDIPIIMGYLPGNYRFIVKKEWFSFPFMGWYTAKAGHIPVARGSFSAYTAVQKAVKELRKGVSIVIFPEGTRSRDGVLGQFKAGSLMAAFLTGAPVIPIAVSGTYRIMPPDSLVMKPSEVTLTVGEPVIVRDKKEAEEKLEQIRSAIRKML